MADMIASLHDFHFQRPWWLLALVPALALAVLLRRRGRDASSWRKVIAPELAPYLLDGNENGDTRRLSLWALFTWILFCVALAGPSWSKLPLPVYQQEKPLVILLDLSPSLLARDLKPDRLTRARLKLIDLLNARKEGTTALIAYAGDSHVVSPLTDDATTIVALLPALHPDIMPIAGNSPQAALAKGLELLANAGHARGDLLFATDGITPAAVAAMDSLLDDHPAFAVSVLGIGTEQGAPIPKAGGGFVKNSAGDIVVARLNPDQLGAFARRHNGRYATLATDGTDIRYLTEPLDALPAGDAKTVDRTFDTWQDNGFWLVLATLPLVVLAFRRNLLALLVLAPLIATPEPAQAFDWDDLWLNSDQQGQRALERGDAASAQQLFKTPAWKGVAAYRNQNFSDAEKIFQQDQSPDSLYNLGNTLARQGQLEGAINAYDKALQSRPDMADAAFNKQLVENLLKQRQPSDQADAQSTEGESTKPQDRQKQSGRERSDPQSGGEGDDPQSSQDKRSSGQPGAANPDADTADAGDVDPHNAGAQSNAEPEQNSNADKSHGKSATEEGGETNPAAAPDGEDKPAAGQTIGRESALSTEQQQILEQWLRRVPDDPAGLLRRKFDYESRRAANSGDRRPARTDEEVW